MGLAGPSARWVPPGRSGCQPARLAWLALADNHGRWATLGTVRARGSYDARDQPNSDWQHTTEFGQAFLEKEPTEWSALLYAGASLYQLGKLEEAREKIRQAIEHGCPKQLAGRVIAAGAKDSVGRAYAAAGEQRSAVQCFNRSVDTLGIRRTYPQLARARIWSYCQIWCMAVRPLSCLTDPSLVPRPGTGRC